MAESLPVSPLSDNESISLTPSSPSSTTCGNSAALISAAAAAMLPSPPSSPSISPFNFANSLQKEQEEQEHEEEDEEEDEEEENEEEEEDEEDEPEETQLTSTPEQLTFVQTALEKQHGNKEKKPRENKVPKTKGKSKSKQAYRGQCPSGSPPVANNNFNIFVGRHQVSVVVLKHQGIGGRHPKEPGKFYYQARVRNEYPQKHIWSGWASSEEVVEKVTAILRAKPSTKVELSPTQNPAKKVPSPTSSSEHDGEFQIPLPRIPKQKSPRASAASIQNTAPQDMVPTKAELDGEVAPQNQASSSGPASSQEDNFQTTSERKRTRQESVRSGLLQERQKRYKYNDDFELDLGQKPPRRFNSSSSSKKPRNNGSPNPQPKRETLQDGDTYYPIAPDETVVPSHPGDVMEGLAFPDLSSQTSAPRYPSQSFNREPSPSSKGTDMDSLLIWAGFERQQLKKMYEVFDPIQPTMSS